VVNDPDCLLVRPDSRLSLDEVRTLATAIGMTGGSVMLSDKMAALPEERNEIAAALLPPMQADVQVLDWLDAETPQKLRLDLQGAAGSWQVLAYFNCWIAQSQPTYAQPISGCRKALIMCDPFGMIATGSLKVIDYSMEN
jgi:7-keto-8-aminopelargonate synthetase-like enzyme